MKVLESQQLLSNLEVLEHFKDAKNYSKSENAQTIMVELRAYLRERPAGNVKSPQTRESVAAFVQEVKRRNIELEKSEILQIINSAPSSLAVLYCLIEEADMRFTEDQLNGLVELSKEYLGYEPMPEPS